jgi:hypothetical protein
MEAPDGNSSRNEKGSTIEIVLKNPSRNSEEAFKLRVPVHCSVGNLKIRLEESYPGNPAPQNVTVNKSPRSRTLPCYP